MRLPKNVGQHLVKELQFIVRKMREERDPLSKLYFFSAAYGEVGRLLNNFWDPELALLLQVLQTTYTTANSRVQAIVRGGERIVKLPDSFFEELERATSDLAEAIERNQEDEIYHALAQFAALAFVTTGNGYYLYTKGIIPLPKQSSSSSSQPASKENKTGKR